jgi:drug/metabolite transporter (DMT)-like permease
MVGAGSSLAAIMAIGCALGLGAIAVSGARLEATPTDLAWLAVAGIGNLCGMLLFFMALKIGKVALAAPIAASEGAAAAVISVLTGEQLFVGTAIALAVITCGVVLAATGTKGDNQLAVQQRLATIAFALLSALITGIALYAIGRVGDNVAPLWRAMPPRIAGALFLALPLLASRRLVITRRALPLLLISAVCELVGWVSYAIGAHQSTAVAAVLSSQFAALAAVAAYFLFGERLTRVQTSGIVLVLSGVIVLTISST